MHRTSKPRCGSGGREADAQKGTPDKADVLVRWTLTDLDPVGNPWHAHGMSYARFVDGKIVEQDLCLDSQAVAEAFAAKAKAGMEEAAAAPI
jgi:hypothetical protein